MVALDVAEENTADVGHGSESLIDPAALLHLDF